MLGAMRRVFLTVSAMATMACGGTHEAQDAAVPDAMTEPTGCEGANATLGDASVPTFAQLQVLFTRSCAAPGSQCHTAAAREGGLNMEPGSAYDQLVNRSSVSLDDWLRVKPGDATHSFMWRKVAHVIPSDQDEDFRLIPDCMTTVPGTQMSVCGGPMPGLDLPPIYPDEAASIRAWICAGAPR